MNRNIVIKPFFPVYGRFVLMIMVMFLTGLGCAASGLMNDGIGCMKRWDTDGAIAAFTRAAELEPDNPRIYYHRGNAWSIKQEFDKALEDYNRALELDPEYASAYISRGVVWTQQGETDKGIADFSAAIKEDPGDGRIYMLRGKLYKQKEELDKALSDLNRAIENTAEAPAAMFHNRGLVYQKMGKTNHALSDFRRASERSPRYTAAYLARSRLLLEEKRYNEALEECSQVLRIFPLAVEAIRLRGDICLATGDYELAIWNYSQAIDLDDQPAVYRKRGRAYIKTGQTEKACADFARACREIDCTGEDFSEWRKDNCP